MGSQNSVKTKIKTKQEIAAICEDLRRQGKKIVTTNGSFDLFHIGHASYLEEAKKQGDILVVGLNSDVSIKQYKHKDRPIVPEKQRAMLIASLQFVDFVTIFDETDPINFIENVKPDVHVNGAEYGEKCIELETVNKYGRLHLVKRIDGFSTTELIARILKVYRGESDESK